MTSLNPPHCYFRLGTLLLLTVTLALQAGAWGPRGRKAVAMSGIQTFRQISDVAFKADESDYQNDLIRGAEAGVAVIQGQQPMKNDEQTIAAVQAEIQLLREVRNHGMGSYFAYRMGVLAALVADVVVPYGVPFSDSEKSLKAKIDNDLESLVSSFVFAPTSKDCIFIRSAPEYFQAKRGFYSNDLKLIANEYSGGRGAGGFLREAGQAYFNRAVEAVTDAWCTVIVDTARNQSVSPSITAHYFVNEVAYLLNEKKNMQQADRAYRVFREVDPGMREAYETIGDLYYALGTDAARERGVKEWQVAYSQPGPQRQRAAAKLAKHFIEQGETMFRKSTGPTSTNTDLEEALRNFQQALEFDRESELAADRINETTVAIKERREKYEFLSSVIDNAHAVAKEAEREQLAQNYAAAITTYNQTLGLLDVVDNTFTELFAEAAQVRNDTSKAISAIYDEVLSRAEKLIEDGDRALEERRFDEAVGSYSLVEQVVAAIPAESSSIMAEKKNDIVERSKTKVADAKLAQQRFQEDQAAAAAAKPTPPKASPFN